jgi:DNA polymerase-3 subunit epsilon
MDKRLDEVEFVFFDTETTGLEPETGDRVVEIAAFRFKGRNKVATFQSLVNPGRAISEAAFAVNNITAAMLEDAPKIEKIFPEFLEFIRGSCLCSYNAGFDLKFLNNELRLAGRAPLEDIVIVDVLKMARRLLPGLERYALWFVAERLGIKTQQAHRAFSDVQLTWEVFDRLKGILQAKGLDDFISFSHLFTIDPRLLESALAQRVAQIRKAIDLRATLKMRYLSSSGAEVSEREVVPKEIRQENKRSYLVG